MPIKNVLVTVFIAVVLIVAAIFIITPSNNNIFNLAFAAILVISAVILSANMIATEYEIGRRIRERQAGLMPYAMAIPGGIVVGALSILLFAFLAFQPACSPPVSQNNILIFFGIELVFLFLMRRYVIRYNGPFFIFLVVAVLVFLFAGLTPAYAGAQLGCSCLPVVGFLCQYVTLSTGGNLSVTFGQNQGTTFYNVAMACAATTQPSGYPNPPNSITLLYANGSATNMVATASNTPSKLNVTSGQTIAVSRLRCYGTNGLPIATTGAPLTLGSAFAGALYVNYTSSPGVVSASNPWFTVRVGTVVVKATRVGS